MQKFYGHLSATLPVQSIWENVQYKIVTVENQIMSPKYTLIKNMETLEY